MSTKFSEEEALKQGERTGVDLDLIARGVRMILEGIGEDTSRPGLLDTPQRVAEMYAELTAGMRERTGVVHVVATVG